LFTGRRVDILDNSSLKIQYNRNRYYDYYTGRWLTHDTLGYVDGMSLYEYVKSRPTVSADPNGAFAIGPVCVWLVRKAVKDTKGMDDKYRHCYVGCKTSFYCHPMLCVDAGVLKELLDLAGLGTPEVADLIATWAGCGCGLMPCSCKCCCELLGYSP